MPKVMNSLRMKVSWSNFGSHLWTDYQPLMAGKIFEHSGPV